MEEHELREETAANDGGLQPVQSQSLPPVDSGRAAWLFLLGCFVIELVLWGFPFSFGVFQVYYNTHPPISLESGSVSAIGTTCSGILYLAAPLTFFSLALSPHLRHYSCFYALPLIALSLVLSSFATRLWQLILTQGVCYGIAGCWLYYPIFLYLDERFVRRKAFAYGIMWAGSGTGGLVGPFVIEWGLEKYGAPAFLRGFAITMLVVIGPLLLFVRPRLPMARSSNRDLRSTLRIMKTGFGFVKTKEFWILQTGNTLQGLGFFIPLLYLPTYASSHSFSPSISSLLPALVSFSTVFGLLFLTTLSDHSVSAYTILAISTIGSAFASILLWGLAASSLAQLISFALVYGFFAGGFTAVYAATAKELRRVMSLRENLAGADIGAIYGLLGVGRGLGNVVCGPLSDVLLRGSTGKYGSGFGPLVIFTGVTAAAAAGCMGVRWMEKLSMS